MSANVPAEMSLDGIFFPDNDNRKNRVIQLGTNIQAYLYQAENDYETFQSLLTQVNKQIADAYREAGLEPPNIKTLAIIKVPDLQVAEITTEVVDVLADLGGFVGTVKYLGPGVTKFLVKNGVITAEKAAQVWIKFTVPLISKEVVITLGDVAGTIIGGVIAGLLLVGLDLGLDALEGSIVRDKLREATKQLFPLRTVTRLTQQKASTLLESLRAVKTTLDAISGAGIPLTEEIIKKLIAKDVEPAIQREKAITLETVAQDLLQMDKTINAWINEDPSN